MSEWRKTTDENLSMKDKKIGELEKKLADFSKIKAENNMLRANQKEWLGSTTKQIEEERCKLV